MEKLILSIAVLLSIFAGVFTVLFSILKLTDMLSWSWLWILSPLWITVILVSVTLIIMVMIYLIKDSKKNKK